MMTIKKCVLLGTLRSLDHVYLITHIGGPENIHMFEVTKKDVRRIVKQMPDDAEIRGYIQHEKNECYLFSAENP